MIKLNCGHHIHVPLTKKAMLEFENDVSLEHIDDMFEVYFNEEETTLLFNRVYLPLDSQLELMIDIAEEEKIPFEKLERAVQIVNEIIENAKDEKSVAILSRFLSSLQKAKYCGTCIWIEI